MVKVGETRIGRHPTSDIVLAKPSVSGSHAVIEVVFVFLIKMYLPIKIAYLPYNLLFLNSKSVVRNYQGPGFMFLYLNSDT